jgi:hypothetical protein
MVYSALVNRDWDWEWHNPKKLLTERRIIIAKIFLPNGILFVDVPWELETKIDEGYSDVKLLIRNCNGIKTLIVQYLSYFDGYERVGRTYTIVGDFAVVSQQPIEIEDCNKESDKK